MTEISPHKQYIASILESIIPTDNERDQPVPSTSRLIRDIDIRHDVNISIYFDDDTHWTWHVGEEPKIRFYLHVSHLLMDETIIMYDPTNHDKLTKNITAALEAIIKSIPAGIDKPVITHQKKEETRKKTNENKPKEKSQKEPKNPQKQPKRTHDQ